MYGLSELWDNWHQWLHAPNPGAGSVRGKVSIPDSTTGSGGLREDAPVRRSDLSPALLTTIRSGSVEASGQRGGRESGCGGSDSPNPGSGSERSDPSNSGGASGRSSDYDYVNPKGEIMGTAIFALQILNQIIPLIATGSALFTQVQTSRNTLEKMIAEKRDPTPEEWAGLNGQISNLRTQLQGA